MALYRLLEDCSVVTEIQLCQNASTGLNLSNRKDLNIFNKRHRYHLSLRQTALMGEI